MIGLVSTLILVIGCADDLRSRKIHNKLLVGLFVFALLLVFAVRGVAGVEFGFVSVALALLMTFPLCYIGALGGGDMKLFAVFALTVHPQELFWIYLYSFVAGAIIGVVRAAVGGQLMTMLRSTALVAMNRSIKPTGQFNIPFSVAMLFGWLSYLSLTQWGGL